MLSELQKLVQVEGPGLRNGRGPNRLQAAGIPRSFIPQTLSAYYIPSIVQALWIEHCARHCPSSLGPTFLWEKRAINVTSDESS